VRLYAVRAGMNEIQDPHEGRGTKKEEEKEEEEGNVDLRAWP